MGLHYGGCADSVVLHTAFATPVDAGAHLEISWFQKRCLVNRTHFPHAPVELSTVHCTLCEFVAGGQAELRIHLLGHVPLTRSGGHTQIVRSRRAAQHGDSQPSRPSGRSRRRVAVPSVLHARRPEQRHRTRRGHRSADPGPEGHPPGLAEGSAQREGLGDGSEPRGEGGGSSGSCCTTGGVQGRTEGYRTALAFWGVPGADRGLADGSVPPGAPAFCVTDQLTVLEGLGALPGTALERASWRTPLPTLPGIRDWWRRLQERRQAEAQEEAPSLRCWRCRMSTWDRRRGRGNRGGGVPGIASGGAGSLSRSVVGPPSHPPGRSPHSGDGGPWDAPSSWAAHSPDLAECAAGPSAPGGGHGDRSRRGRAPGREGARGRASHRLPRVDGRRRGTRWPAATTRRRLRRRPRR